MFRFTGFFTIGLALDSSGKSVKNFLKRKRMHRHRGRPAETQHRARGNIELAVDLWNMLATRGIIFIITIGNLDKNKETLYGRYRIF